MTKYPLETKANKVFVEKTAKLIEEKAKNVLPTPFMLDSEYTDKYITVKFNSNGLEKEYVSTAKQIKLGNYCVCMQSIGDMFPYWQSKSNYACLIIGYILKNIQMYGNYIKLSEKEFMGYSGLRRERFYEALKALLRPAEPYPAAGDNMSLLAATTRKSIYIVNHNFIFRGNYEEFVTIYEKKFPYGYKLDPRGRVILDY